MQIRTVRVMRYVTPLREGGSLPAIVEGDDDGLYVLKFRGAGQGTKALVAELVVGELARAVGFKVPEIVFMQLDAELAMTEPDPEIQDLLKASAGLNLALDYLPGSIMYDPAITAIDSDLASRVVWFDSYTANVDRTARNPNMLLWHKELWLIDHGAALFYQHNWSTFLSNTQNPFTHSRHHVLLPFAKSLQQADRELAEVLSAELVADVVSSIPDVWVSSDDREIYTKFLVDRLEAPREFVPEAER